MIPHKALLIVLSSGPFDIVVSFACVHARVCVCVCVKKDRWFFCSSPLPPVPGESSGGDVGSYLHVGGEEEEDVGIGGRVGGCHATQQGIHSAVQRLVVSVGHDHLRHKVR